MPLESRRKKLIAENPHWGDLPGTVDHQSPPSTGSESETLQPLDVTTASTSCLDSKHSMNSNWAEHNHHSNRQRPKLHITTKNWTLDDLLAKSERFHKVPRVSACGHNLQTEIDKFEKSGIPLVIEGWHKHPQWPEDMFNLDWFLKNGQQDVSARNVHDWSDSSLPLSKLIEQLRTMTPYASSEETIRLYGKDAECPKEWESWIEQSNVIPSSLLRYGSNNVLQYLPKLGNSDAVETLMCYLGIGDTFTPCHKDLCGSSGQNIMCYTENRGSSFWFMTQSSSAPAVADYFHQLGEELDLETYVVTIEDLVQAPFDVYIAEQELGDMVLVPPRSCHQVVNHGGITIKSSWSRMTVSGLISALYHELPIYRRVCRKETYRVKATIYHTLRHYTKELEQFTSHQGIASQPSTSRLPVSSSRDEPHQSKSHKERRKELTRDFLCLLDMMDDIIVEEYSEDHHSIDHLHSEESGDNDESVYCDFCGGDIFQSFFECRQCGPEDSGIVICPSCYVEGRSCVCEVMKPMQCHPFKHLLQDRNKAMNVRRALGLEKCPPAYILDEQQLRKTIIMSEERLAIFKAACLLLDYRRNDATQDGKKASKSCTARCKDQSSHPVASASALYCKKCHASKCFKHILTENGVHSAEALLVSRKDKTDTRWHERHLGGRADFEQGKQHAQQCEKNGVRPNLRFRLAQTAVLFSTCKPIDTQFTKPGWYDLQVSTIPVDQELEQVLNSDPPSEDPILKDSTVDFFSPLTEISSLPSSPEIFKSSLQSLDEPFTPDFPMGSDHPSAPSSMSSNPNYISKKWKRRRLSIDVDKSVQHKADLTSSSPTAIPQPEDTQLAVSLSNPNTIQKKRKRQLLDCVLISNLVSRPQTVAPQRNQRILPMREVLRRDSSELDDGEALNDEQPENDKMQTNPAINFCDGVRVGPPRHKPSTSGTQSRKRNKGSKGLETTMKQSFPLSSRRLGITSIDASGNVSSSHVEVEEDLEPSLKKVRKVTPSQRSSPVNQQDQTEALAIPNPDRSNSSSLMNPPDPPPPQQRRRSRMNVSYTTHGISEDVAHAINRTFQSNVASRDSVIPRVEHSHSTTAAFSPLPTPPPARPSIVPVESTLVVQEPQQRLTLTTTEVKTFEENLSRTLDAQRRAQEQVAERFEEQIKALRTQDRSQERPLQVIVGRLPKGDSIPSPRIHQPGNEPSSDSRVLLLEQRMMKYEQQLNKLNDQMHENQARMWADFQDLRNRTIEDFQSIRATFRPPATNEVLVSTDKLYTTILRHNINSPPDGVEMSSSSPQLKPPFREPVYAGFEQTPPVYMQPNVHPHRESGSYRGRGRGWFRRMDNSHASGYSREFNTRTPNKYRNNHKTPSHDNPNFYPYNAKQNHCDRTYRSRNAYPVQTRPRDTNFRPPSRPNSPTVTGRKNRNDKGADFNGVSRHASPPQDLSAFDVNRPDQEASSSRRQPSNLSSTGNEVGESSSNELSKHMDAGDDTQWEDDYDQSEEPHIVLASRTRENTANPPRGRSSRGVAVDDLMSPNPWAN